MNNSGPLSLPSNDPNATKAFCRLLTGLVQGAALYFLTQSVEANTWPSDDKTLLAIFTFIFTFVPVIILTGIGTIRASRLALWTLIVTALLSYLAYYYMQTHTDDTDYFLHAYNRWTGLSLGGLWFAGAIILFISQSLILASSRDNKMPADYTTYFDASWRLYLQILFAYSFSIILFLLLFCGGYLLKLVHVEFLADLIKHTWFTIPVSALSFAFAIHLADTKANLLDILLTRLRVMGWLLPVMTIITAIFLINLPFVGLKVLWETHHAAGSLFLTVYTFVLLLNAVYRNGTQRPNIVLKICGLLAALMLLPLTGLAYYALYLRIGQYGLSINRIYEISILLICAGYAIGYAVSVVIPGRWLAGVETTNIVSAFAIIIVTLALFTPIADPMRLMVNSQIARLNGGSVPIDKFDFSYLIKHGGAYASDALNNLKNDKTRIDTAILQQAIEKADSKPGVIPFSASPAVTAAQPPAKTDTPLAAQQSTVAAKQTPNPSIGNLMDNPASLGFQQNWKCHGQAKAIGDTMTATACLAVCKALPDAKGCWWLDGTGGFARECRICLDGPPSRDIFSNDWGITITH